MAIEGEIVIAEISEVVETSETRVPPHLCYVMGESPWGTHMLVSGTAQGGTVRTSQGWQASQVAMEQGRGVLWADVCRGG